MSKEEFVELIDECWNEIGAECREESEENIGLLFEIDPDDLHCWPRRIAYEIFQQNIGAMEGAYAMVQKLKERLNESS